MKKLYWLLGLIVGWNWLAGASDAVAEHIYGGDISLQKTATAGVYELSLTIFYDKTKLDNTNFNSNLDVYVFRRQDNVQMGSFNLDKTSEQALYGNNAACAKLRDVQLLMVRYTNRVTLSDDQFNSPGGYYVIWERCCRNSSLTNLRNPQNTGMVFQLDFPGVQTKNSSPRFIVPAAEYVCRNQSFEMDFSATDADGDQLSYELVTPLAGYTNNVSVYGLGTSRASYPPAQWATGFSATNAIPGNPALSIDKNTGKLSVKASQIGLFVFAVVVHEFRGGVEIGQVRREYQLPVVDCKLNTPPAPSITYKGRDSSEIARCDNSPITLAIPADMTYGYQWQRDGKDITGATSYTLSVTDAGTYTVVKKFLQKCGTDTTSKAVKVLPPNVPNAAIQSLRTVLTSKTDTLRLTTLPQPATYRFRWSFDGQSLSGASQPDLVVDQPGVYKLQVSLVNDQCPAYDSIRIDRIIRLFTASAFTPNGDGQNDTWEIRNIADMPDCEVLVYDRWGSPIFQSKGYATPWDGTYNAQKVAPGVYQYVIHIFGRTDLYKGSLHVLY
ncbi:gliding motility-associated C-terminal domain-containing protein [Spirosoma taeanense]|uniref:Gliding motility-associated C-terminal domain-containing protein n=1 Tax=Spirosoma taeanense TaxID=2735870 RepID=A0A6M5YC20_9BACT|nr:gliding motility-associated C-terminal domain-containing protein [Spirosoma taeanense]QJW91658.1 gliding motility-associated C-terminal domain-containing protein [Spirosoma taeanense]